MVRRYQLDVWEDHCLRAVIWRLCGGPLASENEENSSSKDDAVNSHK